MKKNLRCANCGDRLDEHHHYQECLYGDTVFVALEPCPFCGSDDIDPTFALIGSADPTVASHHEPGCNSCNATASSVEQWNRRVKPCQHQHSGFLKMDGTTVLTCIYCGDVQEYAYDHNFGLVAQK